MIDVGSTTTDIVPLRDGRPSPEGYTDPQRLASGELVYTGARRTPLCALLGSGDWGNREVAAELFATTLDAYLILGATAEDPADRNTADGQPATRKAAHMRVARMMCADLETSSEEERHRMAERVFHSQVAKLERAVHHVARRLPAAPETALLTGEGSFLALHALSAERWYRDCREVDLEKTLSREASRAACAYAVAVLAAERPLSEPEA